VCRSESDEIVSWYSRKGNFIIQLDSFYNFIIIDLELY